MILVELPVDILSNVLKQLSVLDLLRARVTCRYIADISRSKDIWITIFRRDVCDAHVPNSACYTKRLEYLTSADCERVAIHSLRLQKSLLPSGGQLSPTVVRFDTHRSVTWVRIVRGRWLLVASSDAFQSVLTLWPLCAISDHATRPVPAAEAYLEGPVKHGVCDVREGVIYIALELCMETLRSIVILSLGGNEDGSAFTLIRRCDDAGCLRALSAPLVAFSLFSECSIPTVLNWNTGEVHHLYNTPKIQGGAVAMAISNGLLAAVFPHRVEIYSLSENGLCTTLLRTMDITCSLGFAALSFSLASTPDGLDVSNTTERLQLCLSGGDGIFLYSFALTELADGLHEGHLPPEALRYSYLIPDDYNPDGTNLIGPCCPTFDATGTTLTWLQCPENGYGRQYSFRSLLEVLCNGDTFDEHATPLYFELEHPDMPALYAEGVYHYDAGLGVASFGNMFGELALFNLSGSGIEGLLDAFEPLTYPSIDMTKVVPTVPVPASFGFPFPYCGPYHPASDRIDRTIEYWKSLPFYPHDLPDVWDRAGESTGERDWRPFIPWTPRINIPMALLLERAGHYYGTVVPLMAYDDWTYFRAGGVLFQYVDTSDITALPPSVTIRDVLEFNFGESFHDVVFDNVASVWARASHYMWQWERAILGRNRWEEMRRRGGDVSESLVENLPPHLPKPRFRVFPHSNM